jgi:hypothetical protein
MRAPRTVLIVGAFLAVAAFVGMGVVGATLMLGVIWWVRAEGRAEIPA